MTTIATVIGLWLLPSALIIVTVAGFTVYYRVRALLRTRRFEAAACARTEELDKLVPAQTWAQWQTKQRITWFTHASPLDQRAMTILNARRFATTA